MWQKWEGEVPGKSMVPLLSASTSLIMSWSSDSLGFWPSERMTVPSSLVVIWPVRHHRQRGQTRVSSAECGCVGRNEGAPRGARCGWCRRRRVLTIAVLVLHRKVVSWCWWAGRAGRPLTNREKASLNSETCSSVRESA